MTDEATKIVAPPVPAAPAKGVQVTEKAIAKIRSAMVKEGISPEQGGLRLGVQGGGCSGLTYTLGFDPEERAGDNVIEKDGVKIIIDMKSSLYLSGTEIDFTDGLTGKGFVFNNPHAVKTCGCGSSFGV